MAARPRSALAEGPLVAMAPRPACLRCGRLDHLSREGEIEPVYICKWCKGIETRQGRGGPRLCSNCSMEVKHPARRRHGECPTCSQYRHKTGVARPEYLYSRYTEEGRSKRARSGSLCSTCEERPALYLKGGECPRCHYYRQRNHKARPRDLRPRNGSIRRTTGACSHCGVVERLFLSGLCMNCHRYKRRTGKDRPASLIANYRARQERSRHDKT